MSRSSRQRVLLAPELLEDRITPTISFTNYSGGSIASDPRAIASGDLTGNGRIDLVIGSFQDGVDVFMNDGSGNFTQTGSFNPGVPGDSLKLVDLTGDGKLDLVGGYDQEIFIALGNGNGTFQTPIILNIGQNLQSLALGDLNGDGKLDLVAGIGGGVAVLMNNGSAKVFASPTFDYFSNQSGLADGDVVIGDFNGDGKPDLAVADYTNHGIEIFLNQGNGTFGTPVRYANPIAAGSSSLIAGDFNNDGNPDLVVNYVGTSDVGLLLGNGDGTFQNATVIDTTATAFNLGAPMAAADFDKDGNLDLAYATTGNVVILPGNGQGGFGTPVPGPGVYDASGLVAADFNGDGKPDLAAIDLLSPGSYNVALDSSSAQGAIASFNVSAPTTVLAGQPFTVTVTAQDSTGATLTGYVGRVILSNHDGPQYVPSGFQFPPSDDGVVQLTVTIGSPGTPTFSVADALNPTSTGSANLTVNPDPVDPGNSNVSFAIATDELETSDTATIVVKDAAGYPIPGLTNSAFSFSLSGGTSNGSFGKVVETATPGTYTATFIGTTVGTASSLTLTVSGVPLNSQPTIQVTAPVPSATKSTVNVAATTLVAGKTDLVTLAVKDASGNPITGLKTGDFAFNFSGGTSNGTFGTVAETATHGTYTVLLTGTTLGTASALSVTVDGVTLSSQPKVTVKVGTVSASTSSAHFATQTVVSGNSETVTIVVEDGGGNPIVGLTKSAFVVSVSGGTSTGKFGTVAATTTPGTYTVTFTGVLAGTASALRVKVSGVQLNAQPTVQVTAGPVSGTKSTFSFGSVTLKLGTVDVVTVSVKDASGNAITGLQSSAFKFSLAGGTSVGSFGTVTETKTPGTYTMTFTGTTAGSATNVSLDVNNVMLTKKLKVTVTA